jgi:hypothetical protein
MVRDDEKGKGIERDLVLEELKELEKELDMKVRECPKCASFVPPDEKRCQSCGYFMTSLDDEEIDAAEEKEPEIITQKPSEGKKKREEDLKDELESEEEGLGPALEEMEEPMSEEDEAEDEDSEEAEEDEDIPITEMEVKARRDYGKIMSFVVILIGVVTYIATPFVVSDAAVAALALVLGAFIIVIGGNMAYSSLQPAAYPTKKDSASESVSESSEEAEEEEAEEEKESKEVESDEEETEIDSKSDKDMDEPIDDGEGESADEEDRELKEEDKREESGMESVEPSAKVGTGDVEPISEIDSDKAKELEKETPEEISEKPTFRSESPDDDSQFIELVPMKDSKIDHLKDTYKCPVCKHSLEAGATECPKCGALFDE